MRTAKAKKAGAQYEPQEMELYAVCMTTALLRLWQRLQVFPQSVGLSEAEIAIRHLLEQRILG